MTEYYTTSYGPTPAEKRKDTIRSWVFGYVSTWQNAQKVGRNHIRQVISQMTYIYDTVESLPDPPEEGEV